MGLSSFSLKRRVTTFMVYIAVTLFGIMSFSNLAVDLMPSIEIPIAVVSTTYSGAGSSEIENLVTRPIEQAVARVSGLEEISSTSQEGSSLVIISFADDVNMDNALVDMREKIDMVSAYLPDGVSKPMVMAFDPDSMPVIQFALAADTSLSNLQTIAEDTISPNIERINGVASVSIDGGYDNIVRVATDNAKMRGYNLSIDYVANILRAKNIAMSSGQISYGSKELSVRTDGEYETVLDIENTIIPLQTGGSISLKDIATVTLEPDDVTTVAKADGRDVVVLSVSKQSGVNTSEVSKKILKELDSLDQEYSEINFTILSDQSEFVDLTINSVITNVIMGIIFSIFVLFIFLKKLSPTLIIAISMPICLITTFLLMKGFNLTLNIMTLGGMAMGVGMIVDNSVVVLENIVRFREEGHSRFDACLNGAREVSLSITASTATTVAVFLPVGLSGGLTGQIFIEFCLTIASLLIASLLIALTLVPLLCYLLLDRGNLKPPTLSKTKKSNFKFTPFYQGVLSSVLKRPKTSLLVSLLLFFAFISSVLFTGVELMPKMDEGVINISVTLPVTNSLSDTVEISDKVISNIDYIEEIDDMYYTSSGNSSSIVVRLSDKSDRKRSVFEVSKEVSENVSQIAGAKITVSDGGSFDMSAMTGSAVNLSLKGKDFDELNQLSSQIADLISQTDGVTNVKSSASERVDQVNIKVRDEIASNFGLTPASIGSAVSTNLKGVTATKLKMDGNEIDVIVSGDPYYSSSIDALNSVLIPLNSGGSVPLNMVADVSVEPAPYAIYRENQMRTITITADADGVSSFEAANAANQAISEFALPDGYFIESGGESEEIMETFTSLGFALIVAVFLVYFVLASQFESIILPFIVMLAMPLGLSGGIVGLLFTNTALSMPAFIGVIMLSGIVVNNSIVLIDYIKLRQENGETIENAILTACPLRVRPVLMTTLTTILGLLPMAFGIGEGSEMMAPMAIVMISGLVISTLITLVFTPVFYYVIKKPRKNKTTVGV